MVIEIYPLKTEHLGELIALDNLLFAEGALRVWEARPLLDYGLLLGAFLGGESGKLIGSLQGYYTFEGNLYICGIGIHPDFRNHGFARQLLSEGEKRLLNSPSKEGKKLFLYVKPNNIFAIKLYKKFGFQQTVLIKECFGPNEDRFVMEKKE